jgi:hypothetical protein
MTIFDISASPPASAMQNHQYLCGCWRTGGAGGYFDFRQVQRSGLRQKMNHPLCRYVALAILINVYAAPSGIAALAAVLNFDTV